MKTRLALLTIAFMSVFAYAATTWKADESTPTAPGSTLIDDEALTVKTVFETSLKSSPITIAGEEFTHFIQVRNANLPSTEKPDGTEQEGSTSLVVTAKKDVTLTVYYRRQPANDVYESNDGKDLKLYNRADMTLMNGILTLDSKTEDEKFGFVTKVYELTEGASYTFSAKGTTIQFFGLKAEVAEPPVPTIGEAIEISPASGTDIAAELATAMGSNPYPAAITINLAAGGAYTVGQAIPVSGALTIKGDDTNPAVIDATALSSAMIAVNTTLPESLLDESGFYKLGDVLIQGVKVNGLPAQLFFANGQKCLIQNFTLDNSVIEVNGGSKNTIDFAGGGVVADLKVTNSTIYSLKAHTGSIYSSQSGQKATEAGLEAQYFTLANSTFYNMANGKNTFTHRQSGQKWLNFTITNCVSIDTGKNGQFVKGINGGQASANPVWNVSGISSLYTVDGVLTDVTASESTGDDKEPITNPVEGLIVFTGDYKAGDFTMGDCPQNVARIGDPRWLGELSELTIAITDESGYATYFNSEYAYTMPEGLLGATVVQVRGDQSYLNFIYKAGDVVPAGTPLLLQGAVKTYTAAVSTAEGVAPEANLLKGCDAFTAAEDDPAYFYYKLSRSTVGDTKKLGFFWFNADGHKNLCELNKAYLQLNAEQSSNFFINFQDEADGIADVKTSAQGTQEVYTLTGVKVNSERLTKGIYIINGKKTVVK